MVLSGNGVIAITIEECAAEYEKWCVRLGIVTISDLNRCIINGDKHRLINICEAWHEQKISEIAKNVCGKKIVLVSGPSSSGKTSFSKRLEMHLLTLGIKAISISLDDYYVEFDRMPRADDGTADVEALESIDYKSFNRDIEALLLGKTASLPKYDFITKEPVYNARPITLGRNEIIIAEGIHGMNPKLCANIPENRKYRVYCSALSALRDDNGMRIPSHTNRMIRRFIRDFYFRSTDYPRSFDLWDKQEEGARKNIYPYTDSADVIFNSSLLYEMCVYREHLSRILTPALDDAVYGEKAGLLLKLVNSFESVPAEDVPKISIIREFVGGGTIEL